MNKYITKFSIATTLLIVVIYWLYLKDFMVVQDLNPEAMDLPLAAHHLMKAHSLGQSPHEYFSEPQWDNYKDQSMGMVFNYPGKRFQLEWMSYQSPFIVLMWPFVAIWGCTNLAVQLHSMTFCILAWVLTFLLGKKFYGKWVGLLSVLFLVISPLWLIHVKTGMFQFMPCVCLMVALAYSIDYEDFSYYVFSGLILAFCFLTGWIVFAIAAILTACIIISKYDYDEICVVVCLIAPVFLGTILLFQVMYGLYFHVSIIDQNGALYDAYMSRFTQGSTPGTDLSIQTKIVYLLKCLFLDMTTFDHPDKYLEGVAGIPILFSGFLFLRLYFTRENRVLMIWLVLSFFILTVLYLYAGRYVLLVLPAMAILAAHGVVLAVNKLKYGATQLSCTLILIGCMVCTTYVTHQQYYVQYTKEKPENFEVDRVRGHAGVSQWIHQYFKDDRVMVVLGDPINFPLTSFIFNNPYTDFKVWSHYFNTASDPKDVLAWEKTMRGNHTVILYMFSHTPLGGGDPQVITNDWIAFKKAHPKANPVCDYIYGPRKPLFSIYEIR